MKRWEKLLKRLGWKYRYGKVSYWDGQLIAISPSGYEVPICVEGVKNHTAYILSAKDLVATKDNLEELETLQKINDAEPGDWYWERPHTVKIRKSGKRYKIEIKLIT